MSEKFNKSFWKWFGDSKVVDKNGKPLVVYHGTSAPHFSRFKRSPRDIGIHFGTIGQAEDRMSYVTERGRNSEGLRLIPVFLSIQNPLRTPDSGLFNGDNLEYTLGDIFGSKVKDQIRRERHAGAKTALCRDIITERGYDGVVYKNEGETAGASEVRARVDKLRNTLHAITGRPGYYPLFVQQFPEYIAWSQAEEAYERYRKDNAEDSWIAFKPTQIKSAIANDGTWNLSDPDIRSNPDVFWGKFGAGVLFVCSVDNSVMLALRSQDVQEPGTWGITGGSCSGEGFYGDDEESGGGVDDAWDCAVRETEEELDYFPKKYEVVGQVIYEKGSFRYTTFVVDVSLAEKKNISSKSNLNWENDAIEWFDVNKAVAKKGLHFGVRHVFKELYGS